MFDELLASTAGTRGASAVAAWARVEAAACARRLAAMVTVLDDAHAATDSADRDQWCIDNWAAVCAHIGAVGSLTPGAASGLLLNATALRDRYPAVGALFVRGDIDYPMVRTIVTRGLLVTDPTTQRALDAALARALRGWAPMSQHKTEQTIDALIARLDPHAVRRTQTAARTRSVEISLHDGDGLADAFATLFATDATALDARLDAVAATACPQDPRTHDQRRSDALGAITHGADRLTCLCDTPNCAAATQPPSSGVIIHLVAHHDTLTPPAGPAPDGPGGGDPDPEPSPDVDPIPLRPRRSQDPSRHPRAPASTDPNPPCSPGPCAA